VIVVGIQRSHGEMDFNPPPDAVMRMGDTLVALGKTDNLKQLEVAAQ
jgi:K+/H+ antiporter YhaU regulatory subunit KhtT